MHVNTINSSAGKSRKKNSWTNNFLNIENNTFDGIQHYDPPAHNKPSKIKSKQKENWSIKRKRFGSHGVSWAQANIQHVSTQQYKPFTKKSRFHAKQDSKSKYMHTLLESDSSGSRVTWESWNHKSRNFNGAHFSTAEAIRSSWAKPKTKKTPKHQHCLSINPMFHNTSYRAPSKRNDSWRK